jgi:hypothetical protein
VGLAWAEGAVWLLVDGGFGAGGLAIDLLGLGLGVELTDPKHEVRPALHGLAVSYREPPVQISGGLIQVGKEYDGEILVELEVLQIAALGSWVTLDDGQPSLFVFAMLNDPPLGGPAFFYVTGLAFGFGYNRSLALPALDQLPSFPFVAAAMAGATGAGNPFSSRDPGQALQVLSSYVPVTPGVDWLAAGVRFTSFKLMESFALLTAQFGRGFQIALLGLSTLSSPPNEPKPIVYAELALEASYSSETGLVAVSAQLTPESYMLSGDCKLTGGFAFYLWTKDAGGAEDGPRAGEFVVTLGGYNPRFKPPPGYPSVPRVGAHWRVSDQLVVKSGMYLAVTPACVMTGGSLEATWESSWLEVTFNAQADFVLGWQPFHYEGTASVTLTGRVRVQVVVTIAITFHLGVWLELHGPPFGGQAHVDLDIASFTIKFGADKPRREPIPWSGSKGFKDSFLPKETGTWCGVRVVGGLERDLTNGGGEIAWVLNGEQLALQTFTVVPSTEQWLLTGAQAAEKVGTAPPAFGVGPVGVADGQLDSVHTVAVHRVNADGSLDTNTSVTSHLGRSAATANQPRALWSKDAAMSDSVDEANKPATLRDMHTGLLLEAKPPAGAGLQLAAGELLSAAETLSSVRWSTARAGTPRTAPANGLGKSLENDTAVGLRAAIAAALDPSGGTFPLHPSTALLAKSAATTITATPAYAEVGD